MKYRYKSAARNFASTSHQSNKNLTISIENCHLTSNKLSVAFRLLNAEVIYRIKGKVAKTLLWLIHSKSKGVTALEISSWALRLASYVHQLRSKYGVVIRTNDEPHDGGKHARYFLESSVEILSIESLK